MSINENPISHTSYNGTEFTADRADLRNGVTAAVPDRIRADQIMTDTAEFAAWHRGQIWEQLNGFSGYDCIRFNIVEK